MPEPPSSDPAPLALPPDLGVHLPASEMATLLRDHDWSTHPLGPPGSWPAGLRAAVGTILNSTFAALVVWGPQRLMFYNDGYAPILGDKHPAALGRPVHDVWSDVWPVIADMFAAVFDRGEVLSDTDLPLVMRRRGFDEQTYFDFCYSPLLDADGSVAGLLDITAETTSQVLANRRLTVLQELRQVPAARIGRTGAVIDALLDVLARHPADVPFARIRLGDDGADLDRCVGAQPAGDPPVVVVLGSDGTASRSGTIAFDTNPQLALDEAYRAFLTLVGAQVGAALTDAQAVEFQAGRMAELAELDRAKSAFFAGVSHELRTPLTLIDGPAHDALTDPVHPLPGPQRSRVATIARNSRRLRRLVDDLLEFSKLEAGRLVARPVPVDLAALTAGVAESFAPAIERAGLEFRVRCPALGVAVSVDPGMWEKVVLNLLSNALKYTPAGEVTIEVRRSDDGGVDLTVTDTGTGIAPAEQGRIFERFHRVEGTTGRSVEGSGIGLALVSELVALHHGRVTVVSAPGAGSTFTVALPPAAVTELATADLPVPSTLAEVHREEALNWSGPAPDPVGGAAPPGSARVLVVDDNPDMRAYLVGLLTPSYAVLTAADGAAGWAVIQDQRPDLVLTDVMMPQVDGLALLAALRADPALAGTPVIVLSAHADEEATVRSFAGGADDVLVKPFSSPDLLARVAANLTLARMRAREGAWRTAVFGALQDGLAVADADGRVVEINAAFEAILGFGPDRLPYEPPYPWWPDRDVDPAEYDRVGEAVAGARASGESVIVPGRHRDGRPLWLELTATAVPGRDDGTDGPADELTVSLFRDVTERRRTARHAALLADVGELLAAPLDLPTRLSRFVQLAATALPGVVRVSTVAPDGVLVPVAAARSDGRETTSGMVRAVAVPGPHRIPAGQAAAFVAGRAFEVPEHGHPDGGALVAPVVVTGRVLGAITVLADRIEPHDHRMAEELAARLGAVVAAERAAERERHLHTVTAALAAATTVAETAAAVARTMRGVLGADKVAVHMAGDADANRLRTAHLDGFGPAAARVLRRIGRRAELAQTLLTPRWWSDQHGWLADLPGLRSLLDDHGVDPDDVGEALAVLPLATGSRVIGVVTLGFAAGREFPPDERSFLAVLVTQAAQALDRTLAADTRRRIADELQQGLLPSELPVVDGLRLAARYLPADEHTAAGGDWYDVTVSDDHVAVTVGDVVGHGARAAAVMGQLRAALAAYVLVTTSPARSLALLDRFATTIAGAIASTAICVVLEPRTGELRWARCGHLPPLIVRPDGSAHFLDDAIGALLGVTGTPAPTEGAARLGAGDTVVLYTDGLVERRDEVVDDGLDRLVAAARAAARQPHRLLPGILELCLANEVPTDDVAIVAVRLLPGPLTGRIPADPRELAPLRRAMATWTAAAGLHPDQTDDLQLAVGEAVANAVEHAYRDGPAGAVEYRIELGADDEVRVRVRDRGRWRPPPLDPGRRGRGLAMIHALGTGVRIETGDDRGDGTTVTFTVVPPPD